MKICPAVDPKVRVRLKLGVLRYLKHSAEVGHGLVEVCLQSLGVAGPSDVVVHVVWGPRVRVVVDTRPKQPRPPRAPVRVGLGLRRLGRLLGLGDGEQDLLDLKEVKFINMCASYRVRSQIAFSNSLFFSCQTANFPCANLRNL